jgi:hypothetical protein
MKWLGIFVCAIMSSAPRAEFIPGEDDAVPARYSVPVLPSVSAGRTVIFTITVSRPKIGETLLVSSMAALSNYQNKTVGNTLTIEYCASGVCYKNALKSLGGMMWLDGGNITADMNHGVYHPSARLKVTRVALRITFGLVAYTYSTQPGGANSVDECHMAVDRISH